MGQGCVESLQKHGHQLQARHPRSLRQRTSPDGDGSQERMAVELAEFRVEFQPGWPAVKPEECALHVLHQIVLCHKSFLRHSLRGR